MHRNLAATAVLGVALWAAAPAAAQASWWTQEVAHPAGTVWVEAGQSTAEGDTGSHNAAEVRVSSDDPVTEGTGARVGAAQTHITDGDYEARELVVYVVTPVATAVVDQDEEDSSAGHAGGTDVFVTGLAAAGEFAYTQGDEGYCAHYAYVGVVEAGQSLGCPTGGTLVPTAPTAPLPPDLVALLP